MRPQLSSPGTASPPAEPQAEHRPLERTLHDLRLIDEYAWLKAENWHEVMRDPFQLDPKDDDSERVKGDETQCLNRTSLTAATRSPS
jgi:hypothetical protein